MDDAHQIVLQALEQAGIPLPPGVDSVQDLPSSSLVSIASKALALIRGSPSPSFFPQSMSERFRICTDLAAAIKELGYRGDLSFHQFLYPSAEETHKLLRFLLDNLSKPSPSIKGRGGRKDRGIKFAPESITISKTLMTARHALSRWLEEANQTINDGRRSAAIQQGTDSALGDGNSRRFQDVGARVPFVTCPVRLASSRAIAGRKTPALITLQAKPKVRLIPSVLELNAKNALSASTLLDDRLAHIAQGADDSTVEVIGGTKIVSKGSLQTATGTAHSTARSSSWSLAASFSKEIDAMFLQERTLRGDAEECNSEENPTSDAQGELTRLEEKLSSLTIDNSKLLRESAELDQHVRELDLEFGASSEELAALKRRYSILKLAMDMACDSTVSEDLKIKKLMLSTEATQQKIIDLKIEWESFSKQLEEKRLELESFAQNGREELQIKLKQVKDTRQQIKDINSKIKHGEEQLSVLSMELENSAKGPLRNTYVKRIMELIKNSKKQDDDISRIIREIRDLQRESNANQGRLRRTHALVDELIFRDAKKDPGYRQAYRLLSSIHENFADCYEKVFTIDKVRREISELQATMETLEKWPVDLKKVQADVEAIVAENQSLEKNLQLHGKSQ